MKSYKLLILFTAIPMLSFGQSMELIEKEIQIKDYAQAHKNLYELAIRGNSLAQSKLGDFYAKGLGVSINYQEAFNWHYKAAQQGVSHSQYVVSDFYSNGIGVFRNDFEAFNWALKAAELENCSAMSNVSLMYANAIGVTIDYEKSYYWRSQVKNKCPNLDHLN